MTLKPTIKLNQVGTTTITGTPCFPPQLKWGPTERHNDRKKRVWTSVGAQIMGVTIPFMPLVQLAKRKSETSDDTTAVYDLPA